MIVLDFRISLRRDEFSNDSADHEIESEGSPAQRNYRAKSGRFLQVAEFLRKTIEL
jgi:hypothetical protein